MQLDADNELQPFPRTRTQLPPVFVANLFQRCDILFLQGAEASLFGWTGLQRLESGWRA